MFRIGGAPACLADLATRVRGLGGVEEEGGIPAETLA